MDIIQDVLIHQTQMMRNSSLGPYVPAEFSPPEYIVLVNALFYASLGVMILAAFIAMLIKSWVHEFDRGLRTISIPEQRAKTREFRYLGMEYWGLQGMVAALPLLIQISLLLFAIGLVLFLFYTNKPSFGVTTVIFGVGVIFYAITTFISVFAAASPFHSPLSRALGKAYQHVHAYFCPRLDDFLSTYMDTTPVTAFGRLRRRLQIFLQKTRPYLERNFVEPITAATVDEVQISTAASALHRIHDSVPNAEHSQLIHQSVWQVAGSPIFRIRPLFNLPSWILNRGKDKEYFSRLSPPIVVALMAVFVRTRDKRCKRSLVAVSDIRRVVSDSQKPWAQLVPTVFDLLLDDSIYDEVLHDFGLRRAFRLDALLREALPDSPSINAIRNSLLRGSILRSFNNSRNRPGMLFPITYPTVGTPFETTPYDTITFDTTRPGLVIRALSNHPLFIDVISNHALFGAVRDILRDAPVRFVRALVHDALLGDDRLDDVLCHRRAMCVYIGPKEPVELINILRTNQLQDGEAIWLLNTLSGLHCDGLILMKHHVSKICLAILSHQVPKWHWLSRPEAMLIEAVVTLLAISCSSDEVYPVKTLTNSYQHPWLLLNLRNPELITRMFEDVHQRWYEGLISVLFLVVYALTQRDSPSLTQRYLAKITVKADFLLCASSLTAIAPVLGDRHQ